ncbi:hypothetical protein HanXRQr2_Chr03g0103491 [Helianthus annuus]|uniref:Uncharacterized protein n=1 Tax=Helianthus annuus TaxID=4232 RepID=A0A9K3JES0_HELAN|nr:hypothetical protein HanXRQr2_Chr03g0103491 [Helianthus annuus]KAJ0943101.1 hypothetical protein HanPSC8_Chr03g0099991 [Helianthus annuus]
MKHNLATILFIPTTVVAPPQATVDPSSPETGTSRFPFFSTLSHLALSDSLSLT